MQILVRDYNGEETTYVWKSVKGEHKFILNDNFTTEDGNHYSCFSILDIRNDPRNKFVYCAFCNKPVKNDEMEIKKHFAEMETMADCSKCDEKYEVVVNSKSSALRMLPDGTYEKTVKHHIKLKCNVNWYAMECSEAKAKGKCKYLKHKKAGVREYDSFWVKHPHAFDVMITEGNLLKHHWNLSMREDNDKIFRYKNYGLYARVDSNGIIKQFVVKNRNYASDVFYSKRYDCFVIDGRENRIENLYWIKQENVAIYETAIRELYR